MLQATERCPITQLSPLVDDTIRRLEAPIADQPVGRWLSDCHVALEACIDLFRDTAEHDERARVAADDLARLARLLRLVDGPDLPFILRQIRRVLARFDVCAGGPLDRRD